MWGFYQDTGSRKWGRPYLTREFFDLVGERMGEQVLLFLAYRGSRPIAGALNFIGPDALYGRYWGCSRRGPVPPFRALLLSGDRVGDRPRPRRGSGWSAGRAQDRPRVRAGDHALGALHPQPQLSRRGRRLPGDGTRGHCERNRMAAERPALPVVVVGVDRHGAAGRVGHSAVHRRRREPPRGLPIGSNRDQSALATEALDVRQHSVERAL